MEDHDNVRRQALEDLIAAQAAILEQPRRDELQRELDEINSRAGTSLLTLQEHQAAITEHRATIQKYRAIIETSEATIRAISKESEALRRQDSVDEHRREEIRRHLDTLRTHCRRQVRADYFSLLRSVSLDPAAHLTSTRAIASGSSNPAHQTSPGDDQEEPERTDEVHEEQRVRRSGRKRPTRRYYNEFRLSPSDGDTQGHDLDEDRQDGGQHKRARREEGESGTRSKKGKKKHSATGTSRFVGPADARDPIEFDEVYAGGNARIKYNIAEYPKGSNQWYILRCLQHNKHFFRGALQAGSKHLSGKSHRLSRSQKLAFDMLSVPVLNCDANKATLNNIAVRKAAEAGYNTPQMDGQHGEIPNTITVGEQSSRLSRPWRRGVVCNSVRDPVVGEIYQLLWLGEPALAVVLPMGDLSCVGMNGNAITEIGLKIPSCYQRWKSDGSYHWGYRYRDGDKRVHRRKYPVMAFQEGMVIPPYPEPFSLPLGRECYDFPVASQLSTIDLDDPAHQNIEGLELAKAFRTRITQLRERPNQQNAAAAGENTLRNAEATGGMNSRAAGDNINGNVDNIDDDGNGDEVLGDIPSDSDSDNDSDRGTDSENNSEDDHDSIDGDIFTGTHKEGNVQANVADAVNMQQEEGGVQAASQAGPSRSADMASSEASGAPKMTTAELTDYLSSLERNLGFGQDDLDLSANQSLGPRGADVTINSYDGMNGSRRQPNPVKSETILDSWAAPAGGSHPHHTVRGDEAHGLPYVEHIDLTCPDPSSDDNHTDTDTAGQEASSASQFRFSSFSQVKAAPFEPPPEPWHIGHGGLTSFGASPGTPETISSRHLSSTSSFQNSWVSRPRPRTSQSWHTSARLTAGATTIEDVWAAGRR